MSGELAARLSGVSSDGATLTDNRDGGSAAMAKGRRGGFDPDKTQELPFDPRVWPWMINVVYAVKTLGLFTAMPLVVIAGIWEGVSYAGPKWGDPLVGAFVTVAETNKALVTSEKLRVEVEKQRVDDGMKLTAYMGTVSELLTSMDKRLQRLEKDK